MATTSDGDPIVELFHRAVVLPVDERDAFVRRAAVSDDVAAEVLALLRSDRERTQTRLQSPVRLDDDASLDPGGLPSNYRLADELGEGGMGRVYRAEQLAPIRRPVAIKVMKQAADSESARARFRAEQQVLARLQHPGIARVLDGGHSQRGRPFLVMDLVEGQPLHRWIASERPLLDVRIALFLGLCDAVQHAHQKGVIHRDLKPSNVLVVAGENGPEPRVIDFGIARIVATDPGEETLHTRGDVGMGTAGYMSPEQARDAASADVRSDVYALGVMLYEIVTGQLPRGRTAEIDGVDWHASVPRPSRRCDETVDEDLDWVVLRAIAIEPERRYATVAELADDLDRVRRGLPVRARPPTFVYVGSRFLARHRIAALATAVALVLAVVGAWSLFRLWSEADRNWQDYRRLVDDKRLADLRHEARDELWPPWPVRIPAMRQWQRRVERLLARRPDIERRAADLEVRVAAAVDGDDRDELQYQREVLQRLLAGLRELVDETPRIDNAAGVAVRIAEAERIGRVSIDEARAAWRQTIAAIAADPRYDGLQLPGPQVGLVPLGRNAATGLFEFWHVGSGERPVTERDATGDITALTMAEATGMVFVLVPGGWFTMGALTVGDAHSGTAPIDPDAAPMETFVRDITVAAHFVARHECTQAQWQRWTGERPSFVSAELLRDRMRGHVPDGRWPVEQVSWPDIDRELRRRGLLLPTEVQWEYFARAGTRTRFGGVADESQLDRHANLADDGSKHLLRAMTEPGLDDGYALTAPVGSFLPNPWGLYDVHGNVAEWCRDLLVSYQREPRAGDGLRQPLPDEHPTVYTVRGGDFAERKLLSRVASRNAWPPTQSTARAGFRATRAIVDHGL